MNGSSDHRGYVLATTLLLLAVAGTALAAAAAESHRRAMAAVRAQDGLQRRWGALTCEQALLPHAAKLAELAGSRPAGGGAAAAKKAGRTVSLRLGDQTFSISAADEQAKVNLNVLAARLRGTRLHDAVRRALPKDAGADVIRLAPRRVSQTGEDGKPMEGAEFGAYGQVFGDAHVSRLLGRDSSRPLAADLTCWGDGRFNVERASPAAVACLCAAVLAPEELDRFYRAQARAPASGWERLFMELKFSPERNKAMKELITTTSACYSLWVVADATGQPLYRLAVVSSDGQWPVETFEW